MTKRKYGKPKKRTLDQKEVKKYLVDLGFEIELIAQEWRHLHAFGKFQGKDAVFNFLRLTPPLREPKMNIIGTKLFTSSPKTSALILRYLKIIPQDLLVNFSTL